MKKSEIFIYLITIIIFYIIETKLYKLSLLNTITLIFLVIKLSYLLSYSITNIIIIFSCFVYLFLLRGNLLSLFNGIILYTNKDLISRQPTSYHLINEVNNMISLYTPINIKTLIDFGCGDCTTLHKINFKYKKVGVEYNKYIYENALNNIKKNNYKIDQIININILDYDFTNNFLLYMYEPLWDCDNIDVYKKLFAKISKLNYDIDIIYLTGIDNKLNESFFKKYNFNVINKVKIGSILLNRYLYYFRKSIN